MVFGEATKRVRDRQAAIAAGKHEGRGDMLDSFMAAKDPDTGVPYLTTQIPKVPGRLPELRAGTTACGSRHS